MSYTTIYNAAINPEFAAKCRVATWKAAQDIAAEDANTPNHAVRADWAQRVLTDKSAITDRQLAMQVLRNSVIAGDPDNAPDGDIQYQVNQVLDSIIAIG